MKTLKIKAEIFSEPSIKQAKSAYEKLAKIDFFLYGDQWTITFSNCRYDEELTVKEFENYLIGIENS